METPGGWLKRTLYLGRAQAKRLRDRAHEQDTTISALVREAVDDHLIARLTRHTERKLRRLLAAHGLKPAQIDQILTQLKDKPSGDSSES